MVPQGSVIRAILFNVTINDIFLNVNQGCGRSLFAVLGAIWRRGRNLEILMSQTQTALGEIVQWADRWAFRISASKSNYMIFGFKRKTPDMTLYTVQYCLYGCLLERVKVFKYLGMWMDEMLS